MELPYDGISVEDMDAFIELQHCMVPMNKTTRPINCGCCGVTRDGLKGYIHFNQRTADYIKDIGEGREGIVIPDETTNLTIDWIDE